MGRIRVLPDQVANQIAAGEVVERPASVVKELIENAIDAGARHIRVDVEAGGRKLIRVSDDGSGMVRDDALLAFERHATSKLRTSDDLLSIATLGFRGEALPSIASVSRLLLATRVEDETAGTEVEIAGGKVMRVDEAGLPRGTTITVRDLFFNTPARKKFLRTEQTELSHVAALVTHYALAHPARHFELHRSTQQLLSAPGVENTAERMFQIFGRETVDQMLAVAAEMDFLRSGLPEPPPWKREAEYQPPSAGHLRVDGFVSRPELQKLNRNSIYVFVNRRLIRDRLILHALTEAYRNILPPTSFPVALLFLEMPAEEVDVNVHPAKTEVRFRQQSIVHDFVRDTVRTVLLHTRPAASFAGALHHSVAAASSLRLDISPEQSATAADLKEQSSPLPNADDAAPFVLAPVVPAPTTTALPFSLPASFVEESAHEVALDTQMSGFVVSPSSHPCELLPVETEELPPTLTSLTTLWPVGQLRSSFILAVNEEGLWIIDQHVAHERILFEKILHERAVERVQRQRLLMPLLVELLPAQMAAFAVIATELERNGFEAEPFGPRTLAVKAAPVGLEGKELEKMLEEVLSVDERELQADNLEAARTRIAASIACHSAIKINTPLQPEKMQWLLDELSRTSHPTNCPHGRPIVLRYSLKEIQRAFQRI
jgi:DNA mismatch repair protein MutL